jgi:hypothetical protein
MSSESVCQVARSWADVSSFHTGLVVSFMNFTAAVPNILDHPGKKYGILNFVLLNVVKI